MKKVLIIEDDGGIRENLVDLLEAEGFEALTAENGEEGLLAVRTGKPDIVVCDVSMPVRDGWQVLQELRGDPQTATLPVIMLTARADRADVRLGMNLGADDYLTKPFTRGELLSSIRARITRSTSPRMQSSEPASMTDPAAGPPSILRLAAGAIIAGKYRVTGTLGAGGMGAVYEVVHETTRRRCALKIMHPNLVGSADMRSRFKLEATVAGKVQSDHIAQVLDAGVDGETSIPFIVMELLRGEDLRATMQKRGSLPAAEVVEIVSQTALGLDRVHAEGILHRDLKPDNLFVTTTDTGAPHVKILDFGIAKVLEGSGGQAATRAIGTPIYMAPEQFKGEADLLSPQTDLYSLGHIAYALLSGEAYWEVDARASVFSLISKICVGPAEAARERAAKRGVSLPPAFDVWFSRAVAANPQERFAHAHQMARALTSALWAGR